MSTESRCNASYIRQLRSWYMLWVRKGQLPGENILWRLFICLSLREPNGKHYRVQWGASCHFLNKKLSDLLPCHPGIGDTDSFGRFFVAFLTLLGDL